MVEGVGLTTLAGVGSVGAYEVKMRCENPYLKHPRGYPLGVLKLRPELREECIPFPCGRCFACRVNKSREWSTRIILESESWSEYSWVTLTYDDEHLPEDNSVHKITVQKYIRKLRKMIRPKKIRYYAVGEYGERNNRPHYHLFIFGINNSETIENAWTDSSGIPKGFVQVDPEINLKNAKYTAGYIVKGHHFKECEKLNGRNPEFSLKSQGLGKYRIGEIAEDFHQYTFEFGGKPWLKNEVVKSIRRDKREYPLGRFLTKKLQQLSGLDEENYKKEFDNKLDELFEECRPGTMEYRDNIIQLGKAVRDRAKINYKYLKKARKL